MIRRPISQITYVLLGVTSLVLVLVGYTLLSVRQHRLNPTDKTIPNWHQMREGLHNISKPEVTFPRETRTWEEYRKQVWSIWGVQDLATSLRRLGIGLVVGVAMSFFVGIAMGCFPPIEGLLSPPISFFAKIPPVAMLPVYFVVFGLAEELFVAMVALGIFPSLAQSICQAAKSDVTDHAISKAWTLGASPFEIIWFVVIQQILPRIVESVRLHIGPALVFLIAAEMINADVGVGYRLRMQSRLSNMNVVYSYLVVLGLGGLLIDWMLVRIRRWLSPWFGV